MIAIASVFQAREIPASSPSLTAPAALTAKPGAALAVMLVVPASILVIADRPDIATLVARALVSVGLRPLIAEDVRHARLILQRETPEVVVLDLATPGHCESVMEWLRREPDQAGMAVVRVSARARHAGPSRHEILTEIHVPKPFTPRQIANGVRTALFRRAARQKIGRSLPVAVAANRANAGLPCPATASRLAPRSSAGGDGRDPDPRRL